MYVDYTGYIMGSGFGADWIGEFAQYHRRQAGWYRGFGRARRRELEIAAHACGYTTRERYVGRSGRATVNGRWE